MPRVVFSVTNCICHDQRILKMAETVNALNCDVKIVGRKRGACCNSNLVPFKSKRFRMFFKRGFLFYMFFNIRLFFFLLLHKSDLLVANDLDTLLPNYLVSRLKRIPLVYDSHEYFTGVPEIQQRQFVKYVWKRIEKFIFPGLQYIITVSESVADQYEKEYSIRPVVVRNCSRNVTALVPFSRVKLDINSEDILLILQGTGINRDRGGEELIEAIAGIENVKLFIVGSGDSVDLLKARVQALYIDNKVRFIHTLPWLELMRFTISADIGLTLDKDSNPNHRFSLPNKLFDYIAAGIPVISSDLPEIRKIIENYDCGIIIREVTSFEISSAIDLLKNNRERLAELKCNSLRASETLNWETEREKVNIFYRKIFNF